MRIGTWNLEGRRSSTQVEFALALKCDVLLLTEVHDTFALPNHHEVRSTTEMAPHRRWAAVLSPHDLTPLKDPHPASVAGVINRLTFASTILPWRGCGAVAPWGNGNHAALTERTLAVLDLALPRSGLVWGGDLNHSFIGREVAGSMAGRRSVEAFVADRGAKITTGDLPHRLTGVGSIDHVVIPAQWKVVSVAHHDAKGLSDHDAYVVEVDRLLR